LTHQGELSNSAFGRNQSFAAGQRSESSLDRVAIGATSVNVEIVEVGLRGSIFAVRYPETTDVIDKSYLN
jgi:hypothetical protein